MVVSERDFEAGDKSADARLRRECALGWRSSGLSQREYAAKHGIQPRTLRCWIRRYAPTAPPVGEARRIVGEAISRLQAILESLDAAAACREAREQTAVPLGTPAGSNGSATQLRQAPRAAASLACSAAALPAPELPGRKQSATALDRTPPPGASPLRTPDPPREPGMSERPNPDKKRCGFDWETGIYHGNG